MYKVVLGQVFSNARYIFLALGVALTILSATLLLPNKSILFQVLMSESFSLTQKFAFVIKLFGSITTNFTFFSATYLLVVATLFAVNIVLLTFYIRRRQGSNHSKKAHFASIGGFVSGVLGIGCAACGSVVLTALFGLIGAGSIIAFLPLQGLEFGIVGIVLLLFSTHYLIKKISDPLVCKID